MSATSLVGSLVALTVLSVGLLRMKYSVTVGGLTALAGVSIVGVPILVLSGNLAAGTMHHALPAELVVRHQEAIVAAIVGLLSAAAASIAALIIWRTSYRVPLFAATGALILGLGAAVLVSLCLAVGMRCDRLGGGVNLEPPSAARVFR
ncbi:MAG TPA: hypothetical protein VF701_06040 [Thermoanaerobaculia bacterium]